MKTYLKLNGLQKSIEEQIQNDFEIFAVQKHVTEFQENQFNGRLIQTLTL